MKEELKYIEIIDTFENESIYVKKCFTAMRTLAVNPQMVQNVDDSDKTILERNYILSMVYNMGMVDFLHEKTDFNFASNAFFVGGETNKYISLTDRNVKETCEDLKFAVNENRIEVIPDIVIHDSYDPLAGKTGEGQLLALEVKTTKRLGQYYFMRDFFKLNLYLAGLHFQNAVFLVINKSASTIDDFIKVYNNKKYYQYIDVKSKLRLFIQENGVPKMYKLK